MVHFQTVLVIVDIEASPDLLLRLRTNVCDTPVLERSSSSTVSSTSHDTLANFMFCGSEDPTVLCTMISVFPEPKSKALSKLVVARFPIFKVTPSPRNCLAKSLHNAFVSLRKLCIDMADVVALVIRSIVGRGFHISIM